MDSLYIPIDKIEEYNKTAKALSIKMGLDNYYRYTVEGEFVLTLISEENGEKSTNSILPSNDHL